VPLYTFVCKKCEKAFELIVPLKRADEKIKCKYCKKILQKIMTAPYFKIN